MRCGCCTADSSGLHFVTLQAACQVLQASGLWSSEDDGQNTDLLPLSHAGNGPGHCGCRCSSLVSSRTVSWWTMTALPPGLRSLNRNYSLQLWVSSSHTARKVPQVLPLPCYNTVWQPQLGTQNCLALTTAAETRGRKRTSTKLPLLCRDWPIRGDGLLSQAHKDAADHGRRHLCESAPASGTPLAVGLALSLHSKA